MTDAPTTPDAGFRPIMLGAATVATVKPTPLLATPPTVTTTFPVVAPLGTGATMLVALQLVGVVAIPLNVIVLVPCVAPKFAPVIVTDVPTTPDVGFRPVRFGTKTVELCCPRPEQPVFNSTKFKVNNNRAALAPRGSQFLLELWNSIVTTPPSSRRMRLQ